MILDRIENLSRYTSVLPGLDRVESALAEYMKQPFSDGHIEIEPEKLWGNVQHYMPKPISEGRYEAHREYCDVQVMIDGAEKIGWASVSDCTVTDPFSEESGDIAFMKSDKGQLFLLRSGTFAVFFPEDAHMPCIEAGEKNGVTKIVFKVKI